MSDEIDRSKEPVFGAEAKTAKKLGPGVRVVPRKVKSSDVEKGETPVKKKAATRKKPKRVLKTNATISADEAAKPNTESNDAPKDTNHNDRADADEEGKDSSSDLGQQSVSDADAEDESEMQQCKAKAKRYTIIEK